MREKHIEQKLAKAVKQKGGLALKLVTPSMDGMPDRLILMNGGKVAFVEVKAPHKKLRLLQIRRKEQLEQLGFLVYCLDDIEKIEKILKEIGGDAT